MSSITAYPLSSHFIGELSSFIQENYISCGKDLGRLAIVFGGQRPRLFLQKELSLRAKKSFLSPRFFSMDEFIEYLLTPAGPFARITDLEACFMIYQLAKKHTPAVLENRKNFSEFLPWAKEILAFMEELDLEDLNAGALKNIQFQADIGYDVPESINTLLRHIIILRELFHDALKQRRVYTRGLAYLLASKVAGGSLCPEFDEIFFCNFFYLHKTEEAIIKDLYDRLKVKLFFQGSQEEWPLLKKAAQNFKCSLLPTPAAASAYDLAIHASFDLHSQVCAVGEVLKKAASLEKTVIVLPDAGAVIPLLSEISSVAGDFNVSMGYPAQRSSVYALFESVFRAQETRKKEAYYTKDYLRLLSHPLIKNLALGGDPAKTRILIHKIEEALIGADQTPISGSVFIRLKEIFDQGSIFSAAAEMIQGMDIPVSLQELKDILKNCHDLLFCAWEELNTFGDFARFIEQLFEVLLKKSLVDKYPLNIKVLEKIYTLCDGLKDASFAREHFANGEIFKIFKNILEGEKVSFSGSPLKGLQILGLLETRSLSFDHVIVLDTNESLLPQLKVYDPLIPRDVMASLGINRLEKEEEIQRYHFMRLLASAKRVDLFYQEKKDREKSRFIQELIWQKEKAKNSLDAQPVLRSRFRMKSQPHAILIEKRPLHVDFLKKHRYSASSINTYLSCPLRFYYQYVLGLKEKEDLLDEPEASDVGNFIHSFLEEIFSGFVGKRPKLDPLFEKHFFEVLEKKFDTEFARKMKSDAFLTREVIFFRLRQFLENEKARPLKEVLGLEKVYEEKIPLAGLEVKFKAKIDRIDRLDDGSCLILDYKTGAEDLMPLKMERLGAMELTRGSIKNTVKSFQLPLYLKIFQQAEKEPLANAGLYSLRNPLKDSGVKMLFTSEETESARALKLGLFMKALDFIVGEILDPGVPFTADQKDLRACGYCPFSSLCR